IDDIGGAPLGDRRSKRPRRARLDRAKNIVRPAACRRNKRLVTGTKKNRQPALAPARGGADSPVVEGWEMACRIAVEPGGDAGGALLVVEADRRVNAITPWFRRGPAAPAQGGNRRRRCELTEEVRYGGAAGEEVWAVFANANAAFRIAGNVPSDLGEPDDSL